MKISEKENQMEQAGSYKRQAVATIDSNLMHEKTKQRFMRVLTLALAIGLAAVTLSCESSAEKVENAEKDVVEAEKELTKAKADYQADVKSYKLATKDRIEKNNRQIDEYKKQIDSKKKEVKAEYWKQIAVIEEKNADMEKRMDEYKADSRSNWQTFKKEFKEDMDELGSSINNFFRDNE